MRVMQASSIVALAAVLVLTAGAGVAGARVSATDPPSLLLAGAVKAAMQKKLKAVINPGLVMTKVVCTVPKTAKTVAGKCTARFKIPAFNLLGGYQVRGSMNGEGVLRWTTLRKLPCADSRTNKPVDC
jgi:hypothetical protein